MTSRDDIEAVELYTKEQDVIYECRHGHISGWKIFGPKLRYDLKLIQVGGKDVADKVISDYQR